MERSLKQSVADPTYLEFFGLTRPPFARLAESSQLFYTEQYALLYEHLENATTSADSLVVICGADGSGKSTLLDHHVARIRQQVYCVVINETCKDEGQFYATVLTQIGFGEITGTVDELKNITREFLVCRGIAGDHVLIIIDNAHLTDPRILQQLRWLCDLKIKDRRVLSVVLAGNADLVRIVNAPAMQQAKFGCHVVFNIRAYTEEETTNYVWHRLRLAGGDAGVKLPQEAYARIHRYSGGIPRLINTLCDEMLAQAHELETRVISEKIVRSVADKQQLLPHVIPLHGKGRRRTDPDFQRNQAVPEAEDDGSNEESQASESIAATLPAKQRENSEDLLRQIARLSAQVEDLRADKQRALKDIDARNQDIIELREELASQNRVAEELKHIVADDAEEIAQKDLALRDGAIALQDSDDRSTQLAADLDKETTARQAAQSDLASAAALVEKLNEQNEELRTAVSDLQAQLDDGLQAADDRANVIEALEKNISDLERERDAGELESLRQELASRTKDIASLELRLDESHADLEMAALHIASLNDQEELKNIEKISNRNAAELRKQKRARNAAEQELAKAAATAEELSRQKQELQATVGDLEAKLNAANERVVQLEALEKGLADLQRELEDKTGELNSLGETLDLRDDILADLEMRFERSQSACELAQQRILELKSPQELQEIEQAVDRLAADLEHERRARESAENELADLRETVDQLEQQKKETQATVEELKADLAFGLEVADRRATEIEALEKDATDLAAELEAKSGDLDSLRDELASRNKDVADLELSLQHVRQEASAAQQLIADLTSPEELEEYRKVSDELATDLEQERRARESAECEAARAKAAVDELKQLNRELHAQVHELNASLGAADKQAIDVHPLERKISALEDEIEGAVRELASRNRAAAELEQQLAASRHECESLRAQAPVVSLGEAPSSKGPATAPAAPDSSESADDVAARFEQSVHYRPAYQLLRGYDPDSYDRLIASYKQLVEGDLTDTQVGNALRREQAELVQRLLTWASDDAILAYAGLIIVQLDEFQLDGAEPCLTLLVPPSSPDDNASPIYSEKTKEDELDVLDITLRTYSANRSIPAEEEVWPDLEPIFEGLFKAFGADNVAAMQNSYDPNIDRILVCNVSRVLYSEILDLPRANAANALRWLIST